MESPASPDIELAARYRAFVNPNYCQRDQSPYRLIRRSRASAKSEEYCVAADAEDDETNSWTNQGVFSSVTSTGFSASFLTSSAAQPRSDARLADATTIQHRPETAGM